jgi:cation transport regulator
MPYVTNADISYKISHNLPEHAQTIFRKAFNNAWKQYDGNEEIAFKVAWTAVKKEYKKDETGKWVPKSKDPIKKRSTQQKKLKRVLPKKKK